MSQTIKPNEHVFIVGTTGSGKSYFAESYLANYDYVIKLDSKDEYSERQADGLSAWRGLIEGVDFEHINNLSEISDCECKKIIYTPNIYEQIEDFYDEFFRFCYERGNTLVWVDELMSVSSAASCPFWLKVIATRGRSKNVGLWSCSQRPTGVPKIIISNSKHFVVYNLPSFDDRQTLYKNTGCVEFLEQPKGEFTFWYYRQGMEHALHGLLVEEKKGG